MTAVREVHEHYIAKVNAAVASGGDDLLRELADGYTDEALAAILGSSRLEGAG